MIFLTELMKWLTSFSASELIAIAAWVIAYSTYKLNQKLANATLEHNKLSVRPRLDFERFFDPESVPITIKLVNNGVGPAIISNLLIRKNGKPTIITSHRHFHNLIHDGMSKAKIKDASFDGVIFYLHSKSSIRQGDKITLISIDIAKETPEVQQKVQQYFERLEIQVEYESIYGEKFVKPE